MYSVLLYIFVHTDFACIEKTEGPKFRTEISLHRPFPATTQIFGVWVWRFCPRKWLSSEQNRPGVSTVAHRQSVLQLPTSFVCSLNYACDAASRERCHVLEFRSYVGAFRREELPLYSGEKSCRVKRTRRHNPEACNLNIDLYRHQ